MATGMPRTKRPYQPSISTYFHPRPSASTFSISNDDEEAISPKTTRSPPLPHMVQASLLSVGMRVRKAVPGGYQNAPSPYNIKSAGSQEVLEGCEDKENFGRSRPTELAPFCAINKIGGYAAQPQSFHSGGSFGEHDAVLEQDDDMMMFSSQTSQFSQTSNISTNSVIHHPAGKVLPHSRKRQWNDDEEANAQSLSNTSIFPNIFALDVERTFASQDVSRFRRPILRAVPRRTAMLNANLPNEQDVMDFEEAEFLRPPT